jgi:hypothetical protein
MGQVPSESSSGGVRLSPFGRSATFGLLYQPRMMDGDEWSSRWNVWQGNLTQARTKAAAVGNY